MIYLILHSCPTKAKNTQLEHLNTYYLFIYFFLQRYNLRYKMQYYMISRAVINV